MSVERLREVLAQLNQSVQALSALGLALRARAFGQALPAKTAAPLAEVVAALGVAGALEDATSAAIRPLLGEVAVGFHQGIRRLGPAGGGQGWTPDDPALMQAAGDVSAGFPAVLQRFIPQLEGLAARLDAEGATFLDVGVGVAALAIEMARLRPNLRVVGLDPWAPALAIGRGNVARAAMDARVELREQAVQDLADEGRFDLAWLPGAFISPAVIPRALVRVRRALRPGGWLLLATLNPGLGLDPLAAALVRLRAVEWGARAWTTAEAEGLLRDAGFVEVRALPPPGPGAPASFTAGRAAAGEAASG